MDAIKDSRVADAMVQLLEKRQDDFVTDQAMNILREYNDPRISAIGLRFLDSGRDVKYSNEQKKLIISTNPADPDGAISDAVRSISSFFRMSGAFAFAKIAEHPTDELVARLTHTNPEIRAAAVAALREDKNKGPPLAQYVSPLVNDPDPIVQMQASTTLRSLGTTAAG